MRPQLPPSVFQKQKSALMPKDQKGDQGVRWRVLPVSLSFPFLTEGGVCGL